MHSVHNQLPSLFPPNSPSSKLLNQSSILNGTVVLFSPKQELREMYDNVAIDFPKTPTKESSARLQPALNETPPSLGLMVNELLSTPDTSNHKGNKPAHMNDLTEYFNNITVSERHISGQSIERKHREIEDANKTDTTK